MGCVMDRSGMIGLMMIPGICGIASKTDLILKRRPLTRDVIFYLFCLVGLVIFLIDGTIYPLEGVYLLCIYAVYILTLVLAPMVRRNYRIKNHVGLCGYVIFLKSSHFNSLFPSHIAYRSQCRGDFQLHQAGWSGF